MTGRDPNTREPAEPTLAQVAEHIRVLSIAALTPWPPKEPCDDAPHDLNRPPRA